MKDPAILAWCASVRLIAKHSLGLPRSVSELSDVSLTNDPHQKVVELYSQVLD